MDRIEPTLPLFEQLLVKRLPKGLVGDQAFEGKTHVLNYYKAKGREFDYVVLVVDPSRRVPRHRCRKKGACTMSSPHERENGLASSTLGQTMEMFLDQRLSRLNSSQ